MTIVGYLLVAIAAFLLVLGVLALLVGAQYLFRGNPMEWIRRIDGDGGEGGAGVSGGEGFDDPGFRRLMELHAEVGLEEGSEVDVLFDGEEVYPRLWEDLRSAERLITWHVFWFKPGELADRVRQILVERARSGVRVLFLYDHFGAWGIPASYFRALEEAGVEVCRYRGFTLTSLYKAQKRSHMRAVVIDGRVGYTGGFAVEDHWQGDGRQPGQWRDTSARLRGPVVHQLQAAFAADWAEGTGELLVGEEVFPSDVFEVRGRQQAGVILGTPSLGSTDMERFMALSIFGARRTLYVTNAYFIPDDDFRLLLMQAVERGVDVRVLTPGGNTDRPSTWYAARAHYEELLEGGVRIWEYRPTMVHAKTMVVDERWSSIGTVNFDNRSLSLNEEVALLVYDREVAGRLHERFLDDLELADELTLEGFRSRGRWERARERFWVLWSRLL